MIPKFLQLRGVTAVNRHEMIARVRDAILDGGGYITDFHLFSNAAICINFEVSAGNVGGFYTSLVGTGLGLDRESRDLLADCGRQSAVLGEKAGAADVMGTLNIAFIHDEPDLRIEVLPIPG